MQPVWPPSSNATRTVQQQHSSPLQTARCVDYCVCTTRSSSLYLDWRPKGKRRGLQRWTAHCLQPSIRLPFAHLLGIFCVCVDFHSSPQALLLHLLHTYRRARLLPPHLFGGEGWSYKRPNNITAAVRARRGQEGLEQRGWWGGMCINRRDL